MGQFILEWFHSIYIPHEAAARYITRVKLCTQACSNLHNTLPCILLPLHTSLWQLKYYDLHVNSLPSVV